MTLIISFFNHFINVLLESAPWLLMGFFVAGLIKAFIPVNFLQRHLGKDSVSSVIKGAILGAPLPLCSCGVIPAALGLRRAGASKAATTSFLIATPETGVDSVSISYALLGPLMAIVRPIAAVTTAIAAGLAVLFSQRSEADAPQNNQPAEKTSSCCSSEKPAAKTSSCCSSEKPAVKTSSCCSSEKPAEKTSSCCSSEKPAEKTSSCCSSEKPAEKTSSCCSSEKPAVKTSSCCSSEKPAVKTSSCCSSEKPAEKTSSCCSSEKPAEKTSSCCSSKDAPAKASFGDKVLSGLHFTFIDLIKDTAVWLLIGFTMAALIMTLIPASFLATWGASPYAYIIMALIGVPMYICATSSTPIAAGLLFAGVSPGAILVFLLVGPATNVATLAIVKNELGSRILAIYLSTIVVVGFAFGYLTDILAKSWGGITQSSAHVHMSHATPLAVVCTLVLVVLIANGLRGKFAVKKA